MSTTYSLYQTGQMFFNNLFDYSKQFGFLKTSCQTFLDSVEDLSYLKYLNASRYMYPYPYKLLSSYEILKSFNIVKIRENILTRKKYLFDMVYDQNILRLHYNLNKIPQTKKEMETDYAIYFHYFFEKNRLQKITDYFNTYLNERDFYDFYNIINTNLYNVNHTNQSIIFYYYIYTITSKYVNNKLSMSNHIYQNSVVDLVTRENIYEYLKNDLSDCITADKDNISIKLTNIFSSIIYRFCNVSDKFNTYLSNYLRNHQLSVIINSIKEYNDLFKYNFLLKLNENLYKLLYGKLAYITTNDLYLIKKNIVVFQNNLKEKDICNENETLLLENFQNTVTDILFQQYELLLRIYRYDYEKFINIIPIIVSEYITNNIKTDIDHNLTPQLFKELFSKMDLNYTSMVSQIVKLHDIPYIVDIIMENDALILDYALSMTYVEMIDEYFNSDEFNNCAEQILNNIYTHLKKENYTDDNHLWISGKESLKVFFTAFLKNSVLNDSIYNQLKLEYIGILDIIKTQSSIIPPDADIIQDLETYDQNISDFNYRQMWTFYENLTTSTLTTNYIQYRYSLYKNSSN